ncbi:RecQ family ATP-dependent DNA helicase [Allomuricauda sp. d1]|uniref:RecQ family ATP-dependent DNA helicase n=1 Tax=Allomuricauda sp. d1 TaxID=3136725 RepID=UPI0031D2BA12
MATPKELLKNHWGHDDFKGSQEKIITTLLEGRDCLALMPTGGGKSLCFQIPAMAKEGLCVVFSPLVALIQNQVDELKKKGIKAVALVGGLSFEDVNNLLDNCQFGGYKFLYLSPERLQQSMVQERLQEMNINLIAIDEAHCISQWGHDFRPAYLNCSALRTLKPDVPIVALTATATKTTIADIVEQLQLDDPFIAKDSFERKNLMLSAKSVQDKRYQLALALKVNESSIVYVRTRKNTEILSKFLMDQGLKADFFHGGLDSHSKKKKLDAWLREETKIMVATNAFGMGIDKSDVRTVVHYQLANSIEDYFQEIGRAGRDGQPANVLLLYNEEDLSQAKRQFLDTLPDSTFLKKLYRKLNTFFQIPYGGGHNEQFDFHFQEFCKRYRLNSLLAYNGLKLLDQNSVISLSENFNRKSTLRFLAGKDRLFKYLEENPSMVNITQTVLRTYGGVFDFDVNINLQLISKKSGASEDEILRTLERLQNDGIITFDVSKSDLTLTFLVPREDDRTINTFAESIKKLNRQKYERLKKMLEYAQNDKICRSVFLLNYFGESNLKDCGKCDICRSKFAIDKDSREVIKKDVLRIIKKNSLNSKELVSRLNHDETDILNALKELLEDERIVLNEINAYQIKK